MSALARATLSSEAREALDASPRLLEVANRLARSVASVARRSAAAVAPATGDEARAALAVFLRLDLLVLGPRPVSPLVARLAALAARLENAIETVAIAQHRPGHGPLPNGVRT